MNIHQAIIEALAEKRQKIRDGSSTPKDLLEGLELLETIYRAKADYYRWEAEQALLRGEVVE